MNPSNYGYEDYTLTQVEKELLKVIREYRRLITVERTAKRRQPEKQIQIETQVSQLFVKRKTLELMIKSMKGE